MLIDCPGCGCGLNVPDEHAGRRVKCPKCGNVVRVEAPAAIPAKPPPLPPIKVVWRPTSQQILSVAAGVLAVIAVSTWLASFFRDGPERQPVPVAQPAAASDAELQRLQRNLEEQAQNKAEKRKSLERLRDVANVAPSQLEYELSQNELATELKYKGRLIKFRAAAIAITRNKEGLPVVGFATGRDRVLRVFIDPNKIEDFADVRIGDLVDIACVITSITSTTIDTVGWKDDGSLP